VFHVDGTAPARASRVRGEIIATMSHKDDEVLLSLASDIGTAGALAQFSDAVFASALHSLYDGIALRLSSQSTGDFQSAAKTPVPSGEFAEKTKSRQTDMSNGTPSQDVDREVRPRGWRRRN
jgi:hypothetical protein